ncbi:heme A synthase [Sulfitobacter undariae]|uniref:Heme A synthase n=1 Tax=Sulfitobacter undariae TaxID=1563671 RepID=A0A7W6E5K9_9RHOB|nr:apolipoprotein acyltransferase [Sulfitobacter undariae]MBB3994599.1 heme A synthase [Sulfitobacter undariae]
MIVIGLVIVGVILGGMTAKKHKGNRKDIAQYATGYGMAFLILGLLLTVIIDRVLS